MREQECWYESCYIKERFGSLTSILVISFILKLRLKQIISPEYIYMYHSVTERYTIYFYLYISLRCAQ